MDHAADGLLALSTTAAALADNAEDVNDDRSSSLSELEDAPENLDFGDEEEDEDDDEEEEEEEEDEESAAAAAQLEADSEAETERLEESPDKLKKKPFGPSPSKLAHSMTIDERPEIEALTDSGVSSPISPLDDSDLEQSDNETKIEKPKLLDQPLNNKRKRLSDVLDVEDQERVRRRRTGSPDSDEEKEGAESDAEDVQSRASRELTIEPLTDGIEPPRSDREDGNDEDEQIQVQDQDLRVSGGEGKGKKVSVPSRTSRRRKGVEPDIGEAIEDNEAEVSDEDVDVDDADAQAKSEEEQMKRGAAMEALMALEQRFAVLRDRLYDERIAQINHELAQLSEEEITHPELQRQVECVKRYRDQKFEVEQKLLVYKVAALKRKSVGERAQIHSAYFQTVRDLREKHLERISEQFYRIQRDRFKSNVQTPAYTIPFPEKRSTQILQQTAFNKEVSILSGIAKYRGFPAAPELPVNRAKELEDDMEKMGIPLKPVRTTLSQRLTNNYDNNLSAKAAGEQFLEQTPWANPQHPINRMGLNRQLSDTFLTPAHQQRPAEVLQPLGSASTIAEVQSQQASSAMNTPLEPQATATKVEPQLNGSLQVSPSETRRALAAVFGGDPQSMSQPREIAGHQPSSPLSGATRPAGASKRTSSAQPEKVPRNDTASPFRPLRDGMATTANGLGERVDVR